jgi:uncharacterized protein DUF4153
MKRHSTVVWISTILLGWLLDFLFWKQAPGINFALYVVLCLVGGLLLLRLDGKVPARGAIFLIPLTLIFAASTFLRAEPLSLFMAVVVTLFLMVVLSMTFLGGKWLQYSLADYAVGILRLVGGILAGPLKFGAEARREQPGSAPRRPDLWPILRGVLIALPVVVIFAALLGSADLVFGRQLEDLIQLLNLQRLPEYVFRLMYILAAAYALTGVFLYAAARSHDDRLLAATSPLGARFLGSVESGIVLGSVIVLFTAFVIVQFRYFFGGQANIHLEGFTYSDYARRGFGELMAVAFFSMLMILGLGAITKRETLPAQRLFSSLSVAVVLLVGVMLVSAFQRLSLYEMAYGFSRLRAYVHVLLFWLGLLLAAVVALEILRREPLFATAALISALGFALTLNVMNVDAFIVKQNVGRAVQGEGLDVPYLVSLSTDSVPALQAIYQSASYPAATRDAVGAVLACRDRLHPVRQNPDWRSFTLSSWWARGAMDAVHDQLTRYRVADADQPVRLITPGGVLYDCVQQFH